MKESSIESRTRDKNQAEKGGLLRRTAVASFFYVLRSLQKELVAVMEAGMTTPFEGIKTLWMTRRGSERIFLADGPGLLRLQGRGYRVLRLVSR
jgi:predicted ATPase